MRKTILWTSQLIIWALFFIYALFSFQTFYEKYTNDFTIRLETQVNSVDFSAYTLEETSFISLFERFTGKDLTFLNLDGKTLFNSLLSESDQSSAEEVRAAIYGGEGSSVRGGKLYYCKKVMFASGEDGLCRISEPIKTQTQMLRELTPAFVGFILFGFLICLFLNYLVTESLLTPIRRMSKKAALNMKVETPFQELQPIADILNRRNEEVTKTIRELSEEKELVEKAQKSKNDFIANITHEMNTPLTSIRGYSELLKSGAFNEEEIKTAADILVKQSERLTKLIARIINYNELDNDDLPSYPVNISEIATDVLESLAPSISTKNIHLNKMIAANIIVQTRQERVNELFGNLLRNSIRYNREGGELTVSLAVTENGYPRLTVADTGIGIAEENLERIFDRFFTVDKSHNGQGGGFGLGLAMVRKICIVSGWEIRVQSELDKGTTFTVDFK